MQLGQGLAAVAGFADHADVAGGGQEGSQALTDDTMVVGDEHADGAVGGRCAHVAPSWSGGTPAGTVAVMVMPRPGALATARPAADPAVGAVAGVCPPFALPGWGAARPGTVGVMVMPRPGALATSRPACHPT